MSNIISNSSALDYRNKQVNLDALCLESGLHSLLYNKGLQMSPPINLVTVNDPESTVGQLDVGDIPASGVTLDILIAQAQAALLARREVFIPVGTVDKFREPLLSSYFLDSCVNIAAVNSQQGTFYILVTKSNDIITALSGRLSSADKKRGLKHYTSQLATTNEEIQTGAFNVIRIIAGYDGVHLSKRKLAVRSARYIVPYYSLRNYASRLIYILSRKSAVLVYRDDDGVHEIKTTLLDDVVADWLGTTRSGAETAKIADWCNPLSLGFVRLPLLTARGQFADVPLLGIEQFRIK